METHPENAKTHFFGAASRAANTPRKNKAANDPHDDPVKKSGNLVDLDNSCKMNSFVAKKVGFDGAENGPGEVCSTIRAREPWFGTVPAKGRGTEGPWLRGGVEIWPYLGVRRARAPRRTCAARPEILISEITVGQRLANIAKMLSNCW